MGVVDFETKIKQTKYNSAQKTDKTKGLTFNQTVSNTEDSPQQHSLMLAAVSLCEIILYFRSIHSINIKIILNSLI